MDDENPYSTDGRPYTAVFTQPIASPRGMNMDQPMQPMQMAQPLQTPGMQPGGMQPGGMPMQPGMQPDGMQPGGMPMQPGMQPGMQQNPMTGAPMIMQAPVKEADPIANREKMQSMFKTIITIALGLVAVTFIGLFLWMFGEKTAIQSDIDGQIKNAVVKAVDENTTKLEEEFTEREKYPYKTFAGPADYGELTFDYPKTWSVYVAKDAITGGNYEAYFNPSEVNPVSEKTINSLRLSIRTDAFDKVASEYQKKLEGTKATLRVDSIMIGKGGNVSANRYYGVIPGTELSGIIVIFKIRDKTVVMQTDSVLFEKDYNKILASIRFNA